MVNSSIEWEYAKDIESAANKLITTNLTILEQLEYRPCWIELEGHIFDHLTVSNFTNLLMYIGAHACIAHKLGLKPTLKDFEITDCYQNYSSWSSIAKYIPERYQLTTVMEQYESLTKPNGGKIFKICLDPNFAPEHKYLHNGGTQLHELVRRFNSMLFNCLTPNTDFSARHKIHYNQLPELLSNRCSSDFSPEKHYPSGGYCYPFFAGFGCTLNYNKVNDKVDNVANVALTL